MRIGSFFAVGQGLFVQQSNILSRSANAYFAVSSMGLLSNKLRIGKARPLYSLINLPGSSARRQMVRDDAEASYRMVFHIFGLQPCTPKYDPFVFQFFSFVIKTLAETYSRETDKSTNSFEYGTTTRACTSKPVFGERL